MLRIDVCRSDSRSVSVALSGDFCGSEVAALGRVIDDACRSSERVSIDLSALRRIDREAVRFLALGGCRGAAIVGCPAYVREWMRCESTV